ncbi:hypothetical protein, partial [Gordonia aichiensis]
MHDGSALLRIQSVEQAFGLLDAALLAFLAALFLLGAVPRRRLGQPATGRAGTTTVPELSRR